jgi:anaerobic magnesium-protoporphyrin IX monomethyl ester cyclase
MRLFNKLFSTDIYPLSLGYLAGAILKRTDWDVIVYNADFISRSNNQANEFNNLAYLLGEGFSNFKKNLKELSNPVWAEIDSTIRGFKPSVVGIYCCSANLGCVSTVARLAKEYDKNITVIVGGPHPSSVGAEMLADSNIDVSIIGEGEETLVEILEAVKENGSFEKIRGIIYRVGGKVLQTPVHECLEDLDSLTFPYEYAPQVLKDYNDYPKSAFQTIMTTRGCNYGCYFCGTRYIFGRRIRYRSVANVTEELRSLRKMGVSKVDFLDDTFNSNEAYTKQLCESLIHNLRGLKWTCYTRANVIDDQNVALMKKAGCYRIAIGVESGNNEILQKMRKGITVQDALRAARIIRKHKIRLVTFFMIGFPGETEKTLNDTLTIMKQIDGEIIYNIFTPYPGTEAFDMCKKTEQIGKDYNSTLFSHQSPENYFCHDISKERFRQLASEIEKYVDYHNSKQNIQELRGTIFTNATMLKIPRYGLFKSLKRLVAVTRELLQ